MTKTKDAAAAPRYRRHSLPIALLRAREAIMQYFRPMLARHELTEQQWRVIRVLADFGPADASSVAAEAFVLAPSLTRILKTLEERGLITRVAAPHDGRRLLITATPKAQDLIAEIIPESRAIYQAFEDHFGPEKLGQLLALLDEVNDVNPDPRKRGAPRGL